jgi:WD40 repeat protein
MGVVIVLLHDQAYSTNFDACKCYFALSQATGVKTLRGHTSGCLSIALSLDGRQLFSSGRDRVIRVWGVDESAHKGWTPEQGYDPMIEMTTVVKRVHDRHLKPVLLRTVPNDR